MMTEYDRQHGQHGYQQYDQQPQQQRPTILERGRAVRLMRNGDPFFTGRGFVINQKKYPILEVFLDDASQALRANFGAVRCIYTPKHGTRLKDISDLEDHRTYVASGGERFKKLHYLDIAEGKRISTKRQTSHKLQLPPVRRIDAEGRALKLSRSENVIIYVYRNGDPLTLPVKILLVKPILQNWEVVLDEITRKVSLNNTAVLKLYAMNGELITSAQQLEYTGMYVAGGKERFKRIEYPDPKSFSANSSPKLSRKSVRSQTRPPLQKRTDDSNMNQFHQPVSSDMQQRYVKNDGTYTHTTTATSYGSTEYNGHRRAVREENDFFNNKPQQHRRGPVKETDLDRDEGGIYKGRLNRRERIHEVNETRDTKIDLPVDYREVETVEEEETLHGNTVKIPRHHHQPPNQPLFDSRQKPIKSPSRPYNDDDNGYSYNSNRNDGVNHRTPIQINDDRFDIESPQLTRQISFTTSSIPANKNTKEQAATIIQSHVRGYLTRKQTPADEPQHQMHHEESNGYQNGQRA